MRECDLFQNKENFPVLIERFPLTNGYDVPNNNVFASMC